MRRLLILSVAMVAMLFGGAARAAEEEQLLVDRARTTVQTLAAQNDLGDMRRLLVRARGVYIVPQLLKAGFIIGGEGGSGVLLARDAKTGEWSPPAFYSMAAGSIGLQIGGELSEVILVIMTPKGMDAVLKNEFKAGVDASIAVGPVGAGVEASTTTAVGADIYAFSKSKGLFGGVSVEGAVITARHSMNQAYYGRAYPIRDLLYGNVPAPATQPLRTALKNAESR